jgi:hypothetical protein
VLSITTTFDSILDLIRVKAQSIFITFGVFISRLIP